MTLSFWLSLSIAALCAIVVVVCLVVRHRYRAIERDAHFWAELHDPPPTIKRYPR